MQHDGANAPGEGSRRATLLSMRSYEEALHAIEQLEVQSEVEEVPITDALGGVLARAVHAAQDQPPFDRATMDGFALLPTTETSLRVLGAVHAGEAWEGALEAGQAVAIMTGAPVPAGCTVVPVEQTRVEGETLELDTSFDASRVRNVARRGEDAREGAPVLESGTRLSVPGVAAAAMAGARTVPLHRSPRLGILTTGDEVGGTGPAAIEDSNGPLLGAFAQQLGLSYERDHAPDHEERIQRALASLLDRNEVVVTVGGVSMGDRDLVPAAAKAVGCREVLHRIAIQPGKPVYLAQREDGRLLMGLPGNPVSVLVTAHLFLAPLLGRFLGDWAPVWRELPLAVGWEHRGRRRLFLPARITSSGLEPIRWNGSGDLYAAASGDGVVDLEAGGSWEAGDRVRFLPWLGHNPGETSLLPRNP